MAGLEHPTIGCCGIDCGLCPRYYTEGTSRCPGCGGDGFTSKHPACGYLTCCVKKHGLRVCCDCAEFPCQRFEKETGEHDSFVTHRRTLFNLDLIKTIGLDAFLSGQNMRINFLKTALEQYEDGRSKTFYCLAAALLSTDSLKSALSRARNGENLRIVLAEYAQAEGQELKLKK